MNPIIITSEDPDNINGYISAIFRHPDLDTLLFVAPYISEYFVNMVEESNAKQIMAIVNANPPSYTEKAMNFLVSMDSAVIESYIKKHTSRSLPRYMERSLSMHRKVYVRRLGKTGRYKFVHAKLMIPYFIDREKKTLEPKYVLSGSVNWTKGGLSDNFEMLIILRDKKSINKCVSIFNSLWESGVDFRPKNLD